jgi:hypothetical protein
MNGVVTVRGATINATVADRDADMGTGAVYHDNRVQVDKVGLEELTSHLSIRSGREGC